MGKTLIATLDTTGFITDDQIELAADRHLSYWFACRRNQNRILPPNNSFEYILSTYQGNIKNIEQEFKANLISHFNEIFDYCEVQTQTEQIKGMGECYTLFFSMLIRHSNKRIDLLHSVQISGESYKLIKEGRLNGKN